MFFCAESIFTTLAIPALVPAAAIAFYMLQTKYLGHTSGPEANMKCLGTSEGRDIAQSLQRCHQRDARDRNPKYGNDWINKGENSIYSADLIIVKQLGIT